MSTPELQPPALLPNNNELAMQRTEMAEQRTAMAEKRTELAENRTTMAEQRTGLSIERTDLAELRTELAKERTRAAEERTLMAWIRTALSMISFGFGIDRLFTYLDSTETALSINRLTEERVLGLSLMTLGLVTLVMAIINHWITLKTIESDDYKYGPTWSQGLVVATVLLFLGLAAFIPLVVGGVQMAEVFTLNSRVITTLAALIVFILMLSLGAQTSPSSFATLWRQPNLLGRSLLATLVLFPVGATVIGYLVLSGGHSGVGRVALGLAVLAVAPGAPLLSRRASMAGSNAEVAISLQVTLALLAIVTTPLTLWVLTQLFAPIDASADYLAIAKQVLLAQVLPLGVGLALRQFSGEQAENVGQLLSTIASTLLVVLLVFALGISIVVLPTIAWRGLVAIPLIVIFGLACGHFLGGPEISVRSAIATGTIARNAGMALFLLAANGAGNAIPTVIAYVVLGAVTALPYNVWAKRQRQTLENAL
jgi:bile acid:Na+ symporter, BASS family